MGGAAHIHPMNQPDLSEQRKAKPNNDASLGNTRRRGLSAASVNMKHVAAQHDNESLRFPHGGCAQYPQGAPEDIGGQANWGTDCLGSKRHGDASGFGQRRCG
jgi:hypothetical protein